MEENIFRERDRGIIVQCIKCSTKIARIEVKAMFRLGFYICESCFIKLDKPLAKEKEVPFNE